MPAPANLSQIPDERTSAAALVVERVTEDLDHGRLVPGQRLVEADLCLRCAVSRGSVREALQRLAADGVVELSRNRGARVRQTTLVQACKTLEVIELHAGLMARNATENIGRPGARPLVEEILRELRDVEIDAHLSQFSRARRNYYTTLLRIGENEELQRLVSNKIYVLEAQFQISRLNRERVADYQAICRAVLAGDARAAEDTARSHVRRLRAFLETMGA